MNNKVKEMNSNSKEYVILNQAEWFLPVPPPISIKADLIKNMHAEGIKRDISEQPIDLYEVAYRRCDVPREALVTALLNKVAELKAQLQNMTK